MKKTLIRLLCALLALCLPACALAEAWDFDLTATMDPEAYPEEIREILSGVGELVNIVRLQGTLALDGEKFDLPFELTLNGAESTRTQFRLWGVPSHFGFSSSLLGKSELLINNLALLEFGMKTYNYLDIPLQYPALFVSPYVHTSAFDWVREPWAETFRAEEGSRTVDADTVNEFAAFVQEAALSDRAFLCWLDALTNRLGYEEEILAGIEMTEAWVESWLDEAGIVIETDDEGYETWTCGDWTLYTESAEGWALTLPASFEQEYVVSAVCRRTADGFTLEAEVGPSGEDAVRSLRMTVAGLPETFPFEGEVTLAIEAADPENELSLSVCFGLAMTGDTVTFTQYNSETKAPMITLTARVTPSEAQGNFEDAQSLLKRYKKGELINVLSVNDSSLNELLINVKDSFMTGFVPLLLHVPGNSYACLLDLLEEYGVLDMLTVQE